MLLVLFSLQWQGCFGPGGDNSCLSAYFPTAARRGSWEMLAWGTMHVCKAVIECVVGGHALLLACTKALDAG
jgi:hypothetical protein